MNEKRILAQVEQMFYEGYGRKDVLSYLKEEGIEGKSAEFLATQGFKRIHATIKKEEKIAEHQSLGGPFGKIIIGILVLALAPVCMMMNLKIPPIIFIVGFVFIGLGIHGLIKNPLKK